MKYTQGNWNASEYPNGDWGIYSETGNGHDICLIRRYDSRTETEANAKLITAAPLMFEALKKIINCELSNLDEFQDRSIIKIAKEAINKATN